MAQSETQPCGEIQVCYYVQMLVWVLHQWSDSHVHWLGFMADLW
jgi:hypothetical protein